MTAWMTLLLLALVTCCDAAFDASALQQIDDLVNAGIRCRNIPGLALAIVKDGQLQLNKGYGVRDTDTQQPVTTNTRYQLASLTKAFTSALLTNLFSADPSHKLSTTLHTLLPAGFSFNNSLRTTYATTEDLLAHRMGIPRNNYMRLADDYSPDTIVDKVHYLPSQGGFRDSFYYNDLMYGIATHVAEILGHKTYKQQIQDTIFGPLGMTRSTFVGDVDFDTDDVATPYVVEQGQLRKASIDFVKHWGINLGSGAIVSTSTDMAKWMLMLLNDGKDTQGHRVLRSGVLDDVFHPSNVQYPSSTTADHQRPVTPESFTEDTYCLGWRRGYYREYTMYHHSGSTFGYRTFLTILPDMETGVVSLMTADDGDYEFRTSLHEYLMDVTLGLTPWLNTSTICTFPDPWKSAYAAQHPANDQPSSFDYEEDEFYAATSRKKREEETSARASRQATPADLHAYTGQFHHGAYGDITVSLNTTTHSLELVYGIGQWQLTSSGDGQHFTGHWMKDPPTLNFNFQFLLAGPGHQVIAVEVPDFDDHHVPVFYRTAASGPLVG